MAYYSRRRRNTILRSLSRFVGRNNRRYRRW